MAWSLCSVCCALNWPLRESFTCMFHVCYHGRLTEVSSHVHVWSPVVPLWHPALSPLLHLCLFLKRCSAMMHWCKCEDVILILTWCFFLSGNKSFGFHFTFSLKLQTDRGKKTQNNNNNKNPSRLIFFLALERLYVIFSSYSAMLHIAVFYAALVFWSDFV